jgi:hypothetical protein
MADLGGQVGTYRITAKFVKRPWWGLGLVVEERTITVVSPPETTREVAEGLRQKALDAAGCVGAKLEEA